jgi:hypothetical protein
MGKTKKTTDKCASEYVLLFLESNSASEKIIEAWNDKENQSSFSKMIKGQQKKEQNKKEKNKDEPKKPMSAYLCFCKDVEERNKIKQRFPDLNNKDIMSKLADIWKTEVSTNTEKRKKWDLLRQEDIKRYDHEKAKFLEEHPEITKTTIKKPQSAYVIFSNENRSKVKSKVGPKEVIANLAEMWQKLKSDGGEEYEKYVELAKQDKERYKKEMDSNSSSDEEKSSEEVEQKPKKKKEENIKEDVVEDEILEDEEEVVEEKPKKKQTKKKKEDSGEKKPKKKAKKEDA